MQQSTICGETCIVIFRRRMHIEVVTTVPYHHMYQGKLPGMLRGTLLEDRLSASTTIRRVHLLVAWALFRKDQVKVSPTSITPDPSFFSPSPSPYYSNLSLLSVFTFRPQAPLSKLCSSFVFSIANDLHRHFGVAPTALITETEPRYASMRYFF